jgi:hypothetical protein
MPLANLHQRLRSAPVRLGVPLPTSTSSSLFPFLVNGLSLFLHRELRKNAEHNLLSLLQRTKRLWSFLRCELAIYAHASRLRVGMVRSTMLLDPGQKKLNSGSSEVTRITLGYTLTQLYLSEQQMPERAVIDTI